ncbi:phage terminase large subunit family protein [Variovorax atrisoli]|uniref:phage terminase large subunit family protein n=1 Tax=Variovorax atrisoli TaxID=3394203 RepID=UPI0016150A1F|nr:phage terminase large subunit family protein [Variovorax sp. BK613]MBB3642600.1 phage terminase large subunit GpA-like protein [Variovorax sp. BK613]
MEVQDLYQAASRAIQPRKPMTVSEWADQNRILSSKSSALPGKWVTARNPMLREPMDCMSASSPVREMVVILPIQFGKSEIETNVLGYTMCEDPCPIMVVLPGEVSLDKFINQKMNPLLEDTPACEEALTTTASRNSSNTRGFKDFAGGQLYLEHAGNDKRIKGTTAKLLLVDEFDSVASSLPTGDDPDAMMDGRTSAFPATSKRASVGTPQIVGLSRLEAKYEDSDQRQYHVPCPHCDHRFPLTWESFTWAVGVDGKVTRAWVTCPECGADIDEHHKDRMVDAGHWVPRHPHRKLRGYRANFLYYRFALGPRWAQMAQAWLDAQGDLAKLKTFVNDRRAEAWEDPAMRAVKHNAIADRAEPYRLRHAPLGVVIVTAGVDTQDNRLAVQIVGWGKGMAFWVLDYIELMGDPADDAVWVSLTELLNQPIAHDCGATLRVEAVAIDMGGHRTEAVKNYVRQRLTRRPMAIYGAVHNNAPVLGKGKMADVDWRGRNDKRGVMTHQVGTVAIKHWLFGRLSTDADRAADQRLTHFSDELDASYFTGLVSETYNPGKNRFEKRRGARNEPLDTWDYAYAATHHQELRLHRWSGADWQRAAERLLARAGTADHSAARTGTPASPGKPSPAPRRAAAPAPSSFASEDWSSRL